MRILVADNDKLMLKELSEVLNRVFAHGQICPFQDTLTAYQWASELAQAGKCLDYAFLETRFHTDSGLELAAKLKVLHPKINLIFCTVHREYAFDALKLYAKGYLMKPVTQEAIIRNLDEMVYDWRSHAKFRDQEFWVKTFGHFEVFSGGQPVAFEREKAKELFAYLIDRYGVPVTTEQLSSVLWEDRPYDKTLKNYVSTLLSSLRNTLRQVGKEDILIKTRNHLAVDPSKIKCDAYDYEKGDPVAIHSFRGEYMVNYSWAEFKTGVYIRMEQEREK